MDLLLAIAGWVARMESNRRSERTKAGLLGRSVRANVWVGHLEARTKENGVDEAICFAGQSKQTG